MEQHKKCPKCGIHDSVLVQHGHSSTTRYEFYCQGRYSPSSPCNFKTGQFAKYDDALRHWQEGVEAYARGAGLAE